jgi:GTPase SAR1 family protein
MDFTMPPRNKSIVEKYSEFLGPQTIFYEETETLKIMLMGEFNAGKSSICNTLLGKQILPTDIFQTTATINRIRYGLQEEYLVVGHDDKLILRESNLETLQKFNADCGTFENIKWIDIYSPLIPHWIEFIDTPGFNDTDVARNQTFLSIAPSADVIIFVCDANQALRGSEIPYIKNYFLSALSKVYFVFNRSDGCSNLQRLTVTSEFVSSSIQKMINESVDIFESNQFSEMAEKLRKIDLHKHVYFVSALLSSGGLLPSNLDISLHKSLKDDFDRFKTELYSLIEKKDLLRRQSQTRMLLFQLEDRLSNVCDMLESINDSGQQNENLKKSLAERLGRQEQKYSIIRKRLLDLPKTVGEFIDKECEKIISRLRIKLRAYGDDWGSVHVNELYHQELHAGQDNINSGVMAMVQNELSASLAIALTNNDLAIDEVAVPTLTQRHLDFQKQMVFAGFASTIGLVMFGPIGFAVGAAISGGFSLLAIHDQRGKLEKAYKSILDQAETTLSHMRDEVMKCIQSSIGDIEEKILKSTDNLQWNVLELSDFYINNDPAKKEKLIFIKNKLELAIKNCRINLTQD